MTNTASNQSTAMTNINLPLDNSTSRTRGLSTRKNLCELAQTYLTDQRAHWPDLAGTPILPVATDANLAAMASEFETTYQSSQVNTSCDFTAAQARKIEIGAAYVRYSDAKSNTRSLDQLLSNVLQTACRENVFIPWQYVFADAAISGTTQARNGYQMLLVVVQAADRVPVATNDHARKVTIVRVRLTGSLNSCLTIMLAFRIVSHNNGTVRPVRQRCLAL